MTRSNLLLIIATALFVLNCNPEKEENEWIELFNGKDLSNWKANESPESFKVKDGMIIANGERSHLFYVGDGKDSVSFKNFELSMDVKTHHLANSGLYFHTSFQKEGWLDKGYEVQINNSHQGEGGYREVKKGGSLYLIRNLYKAIVPDSVWYNLNVRVEGKRIQVKVNDQLVVDYNEPPNAARQQGKRILSSGTFALQGHDPKSTVFFKNIKLKVLPDVASESKVVDANTTSTILKYQANHFAFIDQNIPAAGSFNIDSSMQSFFRTGINLGLVINSTSTEKGKENESLLKHLDQYSKYPVFLGLFKSNGSQWEGVDPKTLDRFDYVIGDITKFKNSKGQEVDILSNQNVGDKEIFMDSYVKAITEGLDKNELDIWASATLLPLSLSKEYDQLWTTERIFQVLDAAKRNNVAIEVNNKLRIPSITFLKLAKEKGCVIATAGLFNENKLDEPDYIYEVIDQCKLDYKDIYIPGNSN